MADLLAGVPLPGLDPDAVWAAAARVRKVCGWHIAPSAAETVRVKLWDGVGWLPSKYVTDVSAVSVVYGGPVTSFTWTEGGRLELWQLGQIRTGYLGSFRSQTVSVTLTHGYQECPPDVREVVARLAGKGFGQSRISRAQIGQVSLGYEMSAGDLDGLRPYTLTGIG